MRKIYCCLTWAVLTVALTACGNNQQSAEPAKGHKAAVEIPAVKEAAPPAGQGAPAEQAAPAVQETTPPADQAPPAAAPHK